MDWQKLFLSFDGRIGRKDFWIGVAILFVAGLLLSFIPLIGLLLLWPSLAVYSKRLHDMGKTAWLNLIPFGVGLAGAILAGIVGGVALLGAGGLAGYNDGAAAGAAVAGFGAAMAIMGVVCLVGLAFLLWVGLTPGEPGDNRYGPAPVERTNQPVVS